MKQIIDNGKKVIMVKCEICDNVYQIKQGKISQISGPIIFILFCQ